MAEIATAFGPILAFMLLPLMIPVVAVTVGTIADVIRKR